jgi:hypothetical protein
MGRLLLGTLGVPSLLLVLSGVAPAADVPRPRPAHPSPAVHTVRAPAVHHRHTTPHRTGARRVSSRSIFSTSDWVDIYYPEGGGVWFGSTGWDPYGGYMWWDW